MFIAKVIELGSRRLGLVNPADERLPPVATFAPRSSWAWDTVQTLFEPPASGEAFDAVQYTFDTPLTIANDEVVAYSRPTFEAGRPLLDYWLELLFDAGIDTPEFRCPTTPTT